MVIWCCVVCGALCAACVGLREGRHLIPVAAGMVGLLFIGQLGKVIYLVWSCS